MQYTARKTRRIGITERDSTILCRDEKSVLSTNRPRRSIYDNYFSIISAMYTRYVPFEREREREREVPFALQENGIFQWILFLHE